MLFEDPKFLVEDFLRIQARRDQKTIVTLERQVLYILNNLLINKEMYEENENTISKILRPFTFYRTSSPIPITD